jgi:hypothetical protein
MIAVPSPHYAGGLSISPQPSDSAIIRHAVFSFSYHFYSSSPRATFFQKKAFGGNISRFFFFFFFMRFP